METVKDRLLQEEAALGENAWMSKWKISDLETEDFYFSALSMLKDPKEKCRRYAMIMEIAKHRGIYNELYNTIRGFCQKYNENFELLYWENSTSVQPKRKLSCFPCEALCGEFRNFVDSVSRIKQVSPDMVALGALGAFAAALQGKFEVEYGNGHREPLSLYVIVGADPAERKTSVMHILRKPFADFQNALEALSPPDAGSPRLFSSGDMTTEQLAVLMEENGERMAILTEEGGVFDIWAGKYGGMPNFELIKQAYDGVEVTVDRKTSKSLRLKKPLLSSVVYCQPDVIHKFINNSVFRGQGLCGRFIYALPEQYAGSGKRQYELNLTAADIEVYEKAVEWYNSKILGFLRQTATDSPLVIKMSQNAKQFAIKAFDKYEKLIGGEMKSHSDWAGKGFGHDNRISAILSIINGEEEISADTHINAFAIGDYLIEHAKAAYGIVGNNPIAQMAVKVCDFITRYVKRTGSYQMLKRDITRNINGNISSRQIDEVLELLESHGIIRLNIEKKENATKPSVRISIHPLITEAPP